jgi:phage baseplate assembly protein W
VSSVVRFLGRGLAFPVAPTDAGLGTAEGAEKVRQSIRIILETEPGERLMRPTFGCGLRRYLMAPNTASTRALIQRDVTDALTTWEPRIRLQDASVTPGDDPALVFISVSYVHVRDGRPGNLVYPFYLE